MKVSIISGRIGVSNGRVSNNSVVNVIKEEMVGQGKKQVSTLMLKMETPKKYISFK
jgi:hypothetical protein